MQPRIDYAIYPTLLDSWWKFQHTKLEEFFYQDEQGWHLNYNESDGTYHYSQEEMDALLEQELIDKINRVPTEPSEAASKGTIFNEVIDCIIERRACHRDGWTVESIADEQGNKTTIRGALDGFEFLFDAAFCKQVAAYFAGALPQYYTEAILPCRYGNVKLYGWIDELCKDVVKDIEVYGEMHRYIPVIAKWAGFGKIGEKVVQHRKREFGVTKFGMNRFINGYLDLMSIMFMSKFGKQPMHFFGAVGTMSGLFGMISLVVVVMLRLTGRIALTKSVWFYLSMLFLVLGVMLFLAGFIGELVCRNSTTRNQYLIEKEL